MHPIPCFSIASRISSPAGIEREPGRGPHDVSGSPRDDTTLMHEAAEARAALREAAAALAEAAARARSLAALLDEALVTPAEGAAAPMQMQTPLAAYPHEADALSPREQEVLILVAAGRTNKAIAEALFVSPNTVKTHVASLLHKLDADTRVQLAAIATTEGFRHRRAPASR